MQWTVERLMEMATAYWPAAALSAAVELDLFELLDGPAGRTAADVALARNASERHTAELLNALVGMGLVCRTGDRFTLHPELKPWLSRTSPTSMVDALRFNVDLYPIWGRLSHTIKTGTPVLPPTAHLGDSPDRTRRFVRGMYSRALAFAPALVSAIDASACRTLLDLASGPGVFSCQLAERTPGLNVTLFDLPPVLDVAQGLIGDAVRPRVVFHPGSYRTDALPSPFDGVLFCGALHQEEPSSAASIFAKMYQSLRPGGRVWVVDMMLDDGRSAPLFSSLFSLNMMMMSSGGRVYEGSAVVRMLADAGFAQLACVRLEHTPYGMVTGVRP